MDTLGISREHAGIANISQIAEQHDHTFQADTTSTVRVRTVAEAFDVIFNSHWVNAAFHGTFLQHLRIMDSLSTRGDFFTTHEEVIRTSEIRVIRGRHGVERTGVLGITMQEIEVRVVFFTDDLTQFALDFRREILVHVLFHAVFFQKTAAFFEGETGHRGLVFERLERVLLVDLSQFIGETFVEFCKDVHEHLSHHIHELIIALFDRELDIQTREFAQMTMGVGILSTEHVSDLEHALEVALNCHLFIELRGLSQTGALSEIIEFKYIGTTFRGSSDHFRCVDFHESIIPAVFTE